MDYRRRPYMTDPGENLLLPRHALNIVSRYATFLEDSGIPGDTVISGPLVAVPIPFHNTALGPNGRKWPATTNPNIMWHPLMWLPERLSQRYRFTTENGGLILENHDEWVVRVALELSTSGIYDVDTGTWVDVLSTVGMDPGDPVDHARITEWLAGSPDPDLDSINLSDGIDNPDDSAWAYFAATSLLPDMVPASWAIMTNDLNSMALDIIHDTDNIDLAREQGHLIADIALGLLSDVPAITADNPAPQAEWARLGTELAEFPGDLPSFLNGPLNELSESFYEIRDEFWPYLAALSAMDTETNDVVGQAP